MDQVQSVERKAHPPYGVVSIISHLMLEWPFLMQYEVTRVGLFGPRKAWLG